MYKIIEEVAKLMNSIYPCMQMNFKNYDTTHKGASDVLFRLDVPYFLQSWRRFSSLTVSLTGNVYTVLHIFTESYNSTIVLCGGSSSRDY